MKRSVLVTGANLGIGLAAARRLAELGNAVMIGSRNGEDGEQTARSLCRLDLDVSFVQMDLNDPGSIDRAVNTLAAGGFRVDVLVNNAGVLYQAPLLALTDKQIEDSIATHLAGPIRLIRALVPEMIKQGYGRIVNVSSNWGSFAQGMGGPGAYGVTKAALNALTLRLSRELPAVVKVNAVDPGWVRSRMGGTSAERSVEKGAQTAVWLATLPEDGPSGGFFKDKKRVEW